MAKKPRKAKATKQLFKREILDVKVAMPKSKAEAWDIAYKKSLDSQRFCGGSTIKGVKTWGLSTPRSLLEPDMANLCVQHTIHKMRTEPRTWQMWVGVYVVDDGEIGCVHEVVNVDNVTSYTLSDQINMLVKRRVDEWDADPKNPPARGYAWVAVPTTSYDLVDSSDMFVDYFINNHDITNVETRERLAEIWRLENNSRGDVDTSTLVIKEDAA